MLEDKDCNNDSLFEIVSNLMENKELLSSLSYNARNNAKFGSAQKIVEQIKAAMEK